jgi:outer membrane protein assembly factor BamB
VDWSVKLDSMPFGAATISNDLVFTTLYDGRVVAYSTKDGSQVWSAKLPAGTNSPLAIAGDRLVTAAGFPQGPDQKPALVVFQLNGKAVTAPPSPAGSPSPSQGPNASPPGVITP